MKPLGAAARKKADLIHSAQEAKKQKREVAEAQAKHAKENCASVAANSKALASAQSEQTAAEETLQRELAAQAQLEKQYETDVVETAAAKETLAKQEKEAKEANDILQQRLVEQEDARLAMGDVQAEANAATKVARETEKHGKKAEAAQASKEAQAAIQKANKCQAVCDITISEVEEARQILNKKQRELGLAQEKLEMETMETEQAARVAARQRQEALEAEAHLNQDKADTAAATLAKLQREIWEEQTGLSVADAEVIPSARSTGSAANAVALLRQELLAEHSNEISVWKAKVAALSKKLDGMQETHGGELAGLHERLDALNEREITRQEEERKVMVTARESSRVAAEALASQLEARTTMALEQGGVEGMTVQLEQIRAELEGAKAAKRKADSSAKRMGERYNKLRVETEPGRLKKEISTRLDGVEMDLTRFLKDEVVSLDRKLAVALKQVGELTCSHDRESNYSTYVHIW